MKRVLRQPLVWFYLATVPLAWLIHGDYGVSWDEQINRSNGVAAYNFTAEKFQNMFGANNRYEQQVRYFKRRDRDYGVSFEMFLYAVTEKWPNETRSDIIYPRRHFFTALFYLIGCGFFHQLLRDRFNSSRVALAGLVFIYASPRFFAESHYNSKDVVFMGSVMMAMWSLGFLLRKPNLYTMVIHGVFTAFATSIRLGGLFVVAATGLAGLRAIPWKFHHSLATLFRSHASLVGFTVVFFGVLTLFWPFLWIDPLGHFIEAIRNMSQFRWEGTVLFLGRDVPSTNLPWTYVPVWVGLTTPLGVIVFFFLGMGMGLLRLFGVLSLAGAPRTDHRRLDVGIGLLLFVPWIYVVARKSVLYDGWRHLYFLYPPLVYFSVCGLWMIHWKSMGKSRILARALWGLVLVSVSEPVWYIMKNHPHQFVYFQPLARKWAADKFDQDYWGLTYREGLAFILERQKGVPCRVMGEDPMPVLNNLLLFSESDRRAIEVVRDPPADYFVTSFRSLGYLPQGFTNLLFQVEVEGIRLHGVYGR